MWMPIAFAAANSFTAKRSCISGSPPLSVEAAGHDLQAVAVFAQARRRAFASVTGMPLVIVQVSGL